MSYFYQEKTKNDNLNNKKIGVLLLNIGSPKSISYLDVQKYLNKFLNNKRIIDIPKYLWSPILYGFILPIRSFISAKKYSKIWGEHEDSPLVYYSKLQASLLEKNLKNNNIDCIVEAVMSIGNPNIKQAINKLKEYKINKIICIPMFPQYSSSSTGVVFDSIFKILKKTIFIPNITLINYFYHYPKYIKSISNIIKEHWKKEQKGDLLLFSYHGTPIKLKKQHDPYEYHCYQTSELIAKELNLNENEYLTTFQSRFGNGKWLEPSTQLEFIKQGKKNINLDIISPSFVSDCLETLEEINIEGRKMFIDAGGKNFNYIKCLNEDKFFINFLTDLIKNNI